jgi:hypothetical protein
LNLVYYAHSYREPDAKVVKFFSTLLRKEGLIASLDPKSPRLNSAKPERHLRSMDGMVAVLTARESGVSPYILYEISLSLRARKPVLVFIEDTLPNGLIPARVLQRRFSRNGLAREMKEHRHAVQSLRAYIGKEPPPTYQPGAERRTCLLSGLVDLPGRLSDNLQTQLVRRGYLPYTLAGPLQKCLYETDLQQTIQTAQLAIAFVDSTQDRAEFFLGTLMGNFVPTILFSHNRDFAFHAQVPREYQARVMDISDEESVGQAIDTEISIAEEEYVDLENQEQVELYFQVLYGETESSRERIVQEINMSGDNFYNYGQAGSMGTRSTGVINNYAAVWNQVKGEIDLNKLAVELSQLEKELRPKAQNREESKAVVAVGDAEEEAKKGDGAKVLEKLSVAGKWAYEIAKDVGVKLAAEAILKSIGA